MRHDGEFAGFYAANYGRTVALVTMLLGDRHEAEDIAQEAFARALLRWSRLRRYDSPEAWIRKVALRLAIDALRRLRRATRPATMAMLSQSAHIDADVAADVTLTRALLGLPVR